MNKINLIAVFWHSEISYVECKYIKNQKSLKLLTVLKEDGKKSPLHPENPWNLDAGSLATVEETCPWTTTLGIAEEERNSWRMQTRA